jgi:1,4-dihydroxy-2-naphthoate octaprenyltransferase
MSSRARSRRRNANGSGLWAFVRLARPHFLIGGFVLYGLGVLILRYERLPFSPGLFWTGQALVTSLQLMTHFLNDYWDVESDRANRNRTLFSGGSGMLPSGQIDRQTAFNAAIACLVVAGVAAFVLALSLQVRPIAWGIAGLALAGAWFYSSPPLQLASSGFGELTTSLLVALLLPAFGYSLQAGRISPLVLWTALPLITFHLAMLIAFEVPDLQSDTETGKRTLLVRLGQRWGTRLHTLCIVAAYALLGVAQLAGVPLLVVLSGAVPFPLALAQATTVHWLAGRNAGTRRGSPMLQYHWVTAGAVALFAVTASLMALGYWRLT